MGSTLATAKPAALGSRHVLHLGLADADLKGDVAILLDGTVGYHLTLIDFKHCHGDMFASIRKDAGHADLLCNDA